MEISEHMGRLSKNLLLRGHCLYMCVSVRMRVCACARICVHGMYMCMVYACECVAFMPIGKHAETREGSQVFFSKALCSPALRQGL